MRNIDADRLKKEFDKVHSRFSWENFTFIMDTIDRMPTSEPTIDPVKHAHYEYAPLYGRQICSNCGAPTLLDYNQDGITSRYCYSCGCRMDEVTE